MMTWLVKKSLINFKKSQKLHHRLFQGHLQMKQKILDLIGKYVKERYTSERKCKLFDVTKFISVLPTFPVIQKSLSSVRWWMKKLHLIAEKQSGIIR